MLADQVRSCALTDPVVFGLPRGGVPVAFEVAKALGAPLDVLVARKVGAPGNPELAIGAIAEGGLRGLAAPVGAADSVEALASEADEVVCVLVPEHLLAVGFWYADFGQTSDREVLELLARARELHASVSSRSS